MSALPSSQYAGADDRPAIATARQDEISAPMLNFRSLFAARAEFLWPSKQDVLCLVNTRGKISRAALIRVKLHHQLPMRGADFLLARPLVESKHLKGLLARHADFPA